MLVVEDIEGMRAILGTLPWATVDGFPSELVPVDRFEMVVSYGWNA